MATKPLNILLLSGVLALGGCATNPLEAIGVGPRGEVREISTALVDFSPTPVARIQGDSSLVAGGAPLNSVINSLSVKAGYIVTYTDEVDLTQKVSASVSNVSLDDAIQETALRAGYAAVIDHAKAAVLISSEAVNTFKFPQSAVQALTAQAQTATAVSGPTALNQFLKSIAGNVSTQVSVSDQGYVAVRSDAKGLARVRTFMRKFNADALARVELEALVVEVSLSKAYSEGINWEEVLGTPAGMSSPSFTWAPPPSNVVISQGVWPDVFSASTKNLAAFKVTASPQLIKGSLLNANSNADTPTSAKLLSLNNSFNPAKEGVAVTFSEVGPIASKASAGASTTPAFTVGGITFLASASITGEHTVQLTLSPRSGTATSPQMQVLATESKTLVITGIRYPKRPEQGSVIERTLGFDRPTEAVILLRPRIIPAVDSDPLVAQSL